MSRVLVPDTAGSTAEALLRDLRDRGFDLRRPVFIAYVVDLREDRDLAYLLSRRAADEGWRASLYADDTGWVARLGRIVRPRVDVLVQAEQDAYDLAATYEAEVRGVCVEDLTGNDDAWAWLADRLRDRLINADDEQPLPAGALPRSA